jgi:hypothetical protein
MKYKMKIKIKYKAFIYVPALQNDVVLASKPQWIKKPIKKGKPIFINPGFALQV